MIIPERAFLARTGQAWKVYLSLGMLGLAGILLFSGFISGTESKWFGPSMLIGIVMGISAFIFEVVAIRCQTCGTNLGWKALKGEWTFVSEECVQCGSARIPKEV